MDKREEALQFIQKHDASIIEFGTGTGKTKIALDAVNGKILVCYKQTPHLENWHAECTKWNIVKDITYTTYDSLHHLAGTSWDWIILDEAHAGTDLRVEKLKLLNTKKWICLTATLPHDKKLLLKQLANFKSIKYTLDDAINDGLLPEGKIYIVDKHLDNKYPTLTYFRKLPRKVKNQENEMLHINFSERTKYTYGVNLYIKCTEYQYYECLSEDVEYLKFQYFKGRQEYQKNLWLQAATKRKTWLSSLKTDVAAKILGARLRNKRSVIFAHTADQLERLNIKDYIYSARGKKYNQDLIQRFNNKEFDWLFNLKVLNEGMNLEGIEAGLVIAIDASPLSSIQRMGRVWRSSSPEVYFIRIPFTKDAENFEKLFKEIKQEFVSLDEKDL